MPKKQIKTSALVTTAVLYGIVGLFALVILKAVFSSIGNTGSTIANQQPLLRATPTGLPSIPTDTPELTTPSEKDHKTIEDAVSHVLMSYAPSNANSNDTIDYSKAGWSKREPLIREIDYSDNGGLNIYFSSWTDGNTYMDASDYNMAEEEIGYILKSLKTLTLNTPLSHIAISAWGTQQNISDCSSISIGRMVLVSLSSTQLQSFSTDGLDNMAGIDIINSLNSGGVKTEIDDSTRVCGQNTGN